MKILIDAHMLGARQTGNETYVRGLLRGLAGLDAGDRLIVAAADPRAATRALADLPALEVHPVSSRPLRRLWVDLPRLAARTRADVVHVTYFAPRACGCPVVVTVHDVSFRPHPEWFSPRDRWVLALGVPWSLRRAAAVLTLSEFSAREIRAHFGTPAGRLTVIPLAADLRYTPRPPDVPAGGLPGGVSGPYVLAVGNLQPRKNLATVIEAFARLPAALRETHRLVIAGQAHWRGSETMDRVARLGLQDRVAFTGYVDDAMLVTLYQQAAASVYLSLYEGFGLPVLEAMACGTPVVASAVPAIEEVAGEAAWLVNPQSPEALADALTRLLPDAAARALQREKGLRRAAGFSWLETARRTRRVYAQVAGVAA